MGSRVLLSQDLSASKFSMIILETIHRGPDADHTPELTQVAAAAAPSSARRPRGPRWEAPVAGPREPRPASSSPGPPQVARPPGAGRFPSADPGPGGGSNRLPGPSPLPCSPANPPEGGPNALTPGLSSQLWDWVLVGNAAEEK